MTEPLSRAQLEAIELVVRKAVNDAFADVGLRVDDATHQDEAREDLRFLRRARRMFDGAAAKVGGAVILSAVAIIFTIIGLGFWSWLGKGLGK